MIGREYVKFTLKIILAALALLGFFLFSLYLLTLAYEEVFFEREGTTSKILSVEKCYHYRHSMSLSCFELVDDGSEDALEAVVYNGSLASSYKVDDNMIIRYPRFKGFSNYVVVEGRLDFHFFPLVGAVILSFFFIAFVTDKITAVSSENEEG